MANPVLKARLKVAAAHGQFIEVAEHGHIQLLIRKHFKRLFSIQFLLL